MTHMICEALRRLGELVPCSSTPLQIVYGTCIQCVSKNAWSIFAVTLLFDGMNSALETGKKASKLLARFGELPVVCPKHVSLGPGARLTNDPGVGHQRRGAAARQVSR